MEWTIPAFAFPAEALSIYQARELFQLLQIQMENIPIGVLSVAITSRITVSKFLLDL